MWKRSEPALGQPEADPGDPVGLRAPGLGPGVVDVLDRQVKLVLVAIVLAAELGAAIGEDALQDDRMLVVERDHPIVQQVTAMSAVFPSPRSGSPAGGQAASLAIPTPGMANAPCAFSGA